MRMLVPQDAPGDQDEFGRDDQHKGGGQQEYGGESPVLRFDWPTAAQAAKAKDQEDAEGDEQCESAELAPATPPPNSVPD